MRTLILYLILILSTTGFAQNNPTIYGRVNKLSIGPDQSIWLTTSTGNIYQAPNLDSNWTIILETNPETGYKTASPHMDRILFFNNDTAIVYGYLTKSFYEEKKNKIYRTTNGGKSWKWIEFGKGDHWIRDGQSFKDGTCWIASNKGYFYISKDYGKTWTQTPKMFDRVKEAYMRGPDIYSFHYLNNNVAIAANKNNQLAISSNNFEKFKRISTPLDNNLFEKQYKSYYLNGSGRKYIKNMLISKVRIFSDYYFVLQNGELYYSVQDNIEWKKYPIDIFGFEIDESSGRMYAVTKELKVVEIKKDLNSNELSEVSINGQYVNMKIVDSSVFILTASYTSNVGKDKAREQYGNLTVVQKNYKELTGYNIYRINEIGIKSIELNAK
jgi:hypothetical protein